MIFNSISKELNQSRYSNRQTGTHGSYFPTPQNPFNPPVNILHPAPRQSSLSKMNAKITQNIQYLKQKDYPKMGELRSSRVSMRSNQSGRSNRSYGSKSQINTFSKQNQHYFPTSGLPQAPWEKQRYEYSHQQPIAQKIVTQTIQPTHHNYYKPQQQILGQFSQNKHSNSRQKIQHRSTQDLHRKPVTVDLARFDINKYSSHDRRPEPAQKDFGKSIKSSFSQSFQDFQQTNNMQRPVRQNSQTFGSQVRQMESPLNWIQPQGIKQGSRVSQRPSYVYKPLASPQSPINFVSKNTEIPTKIQAKIDTVLTEPVSPLPKPSKKKQAMILTAGLIALGIIIFLLQLSK